MTAKIPPNCRVFIGNLASSKTSADELKHIFSKYGRLAEEPVIRKNFGFVQYLNEGHAREAIQQENGTVIGGLRIDLNLADNRPSRRQQTDAVSNAGEIENNRRDREDSRVVAREAAVNRSERFEKTSRPSWMGSDSSNQGAPRRKGNDGVRLDTDPSPFMTGARINPPDSLNDVFLIIVDNPSRRYCLMIEEEITKLGLIYESREVQLFDLPDTLKVAAELSRIKNVVIVGSRHEHLETVTISTRLPSGTIEEFREVPLVEALRQLVPNRPFHGAGGERGSLRFDDPRNTMTQSISSVSRLEGRRDPRSDFREDPSLSRSRQADALGPIQATDPPGVQEMLQNFLQQIQSQGGQAALSNENVRAHLLQTLQSNPALVQFLVSKVQPQLATHTAKSDYHETQLRSHHREPQLDRAISDALLNGGYGGGSTSQSIIQAALSGSKSLSMGSFAAVPPPHAAGWSGAAGGGGLDRRFNGGSSDGYQHAQPSSAPSAPGLSGLDYSILQDLLAATAPLLDTGEPVRMQQHGALPSRRGSGGVALPPHNQMQPQWSLTQNGGGGFEPAARRNGPEFAGNGPGGGLGPSSVDLLNLLARPLSASASAPMGGGGGDMRDSWAVGMTPDAQRFATAGNGLLQSPMPPGAQLFVPR